MPKLHRRDVLALLALGLLGAGCSRPVADPPADAAPTERPLVTIFKPPS